MKNVQSLKPIALAAILSLSLFTSNSIASVVTALPGGSVVTLPAVNYFGAGPQAVAPGITWSSSNASYQGGSVFGYTGGYGFGANGGWTMNMAGLNSSKDVYGSVDTMSFAFDTPVQGVGGFLNYVPGGSTPTTIAVYDAGMNLIESFNLSFLTDGSTNSGMFYGFLESAANISYFTLSDNYIGITDLTVLPNSVPEPSGLAVVGLGLAALAGLRRKATRS